MYGRGRINRSTPIHTLFLTHSTLCFLHREGSIEVNPCGQVVPHVYSVKCTYIKTWWEENEPGQEVDLKVLAPRLPGATMFLNDLKLDRVKVLSAQHAKLLLNLFLVQLILIV